MVKNPPAMWETWVWSLGWEDRLEKRTAEFSSILAWRIPWTEKPGGLQTMGLQRGARLSNFPEKAVAPHSSTLAWKIPWTEEPDGLPSMGSQGVRYDWSDLAAAAAAAADYTSPWNSLGQNTGVGSLSLLQGIFPTQGSNSGLPHCRWIVYELSHKGSPCVKD